MFRHQLSHSTLFLSLHLQQPQRILQPKVRFAISSTKNIDMSKIFYVAKPIIKFRMHKI